MFCDAYRSTPTSVYIVVVGFVARLLATVEGEGRWVSDVGVRHECWPSNTAEKIALISEIYFLPWAPFPFPSFLSLSLSCSCTMYPSFSLSILHSLLSHSRYPAEILALNLNWHSAIYHRFRRGHTWFSDHQPLSSPRLFSPLCSPSSSTRQFWFSASEFSMHDQGSRHSTPRCCRLFIVALQWGWRPSAIRQHKWRRRKSRREAVRRKAWGTGGYPLLVQCTYICYFLSCEAITENLNKLWMEFVWGNSQDQRGYQSLP